MAKTKVGILVTELRTKAEKFEQGLRRGSKAVDKHKRALGGLAKAAGLAGAALNVGVVAGLVAITAKAVRAADEVAKMSKRLQTSTEFMSEFKFVAEQSGIAFTTFTMALQRLNRRIGDVRAGATILDSAFESTGLTLDDLGGSSEENFKKVIKGLNGISNAQDRLSAAAKFFDSEGVAVLQFSENIEDLTEQAKLLGVTLDKETAASAEQLTDAMGRIGAAMNGVGNAIIRNLGPSLANLANFLAFEIPSATSGFEQIFLRIKLSVLEFGATLDELQAKKIDIQRIFAFGDADKQLAEQARFLEESAISLRLEAGQTAEALAQAIERGNAARERSAKGFQFEGVSGQSGVDPSGFQKVGAQSGAGFKQAGIDAAVFKEELIKAAMAERELAFAAGQRATELAKESEVTAGSGLQALEQWLEQQEAFEESREGFRQAEATRREEDLEALAEWLDQDSALRAAKLGFDQAQEKKAAKAQEAIRLAALKRDQKIQLAGIRVSQLFESKAANEKLGLAKASFANLSALMATENRRLFQIGKIAAIANATVSGIEAVVHSYRAGAQIGGPVLGAAFAATAAAATGAQIAALSSASFGGGGGVSNATGGGGGGGAAAVGALPSIPALEADELNERQRRGTITINVIGDVIGAGGAFDEVVKDAVAGAFASIDSDQLGSSNTTVNIEAIKDAINNDEIIIQQGSRQFTELTQI